MTILITNDSYSPKLKQILVLILCWVSYLFSTPLSAAPDVIVNYDVFRESLHLESHFSYKAVDRNNFTIDQLTQADGWQDAKNIQVSNFDPKDSWLKFTINNHSDLKKKFVIAQTNPQIPNIDLWKKEDGKLIHLYSVGARKPFSERPIEHRYFVLPITVYPFETAEFYIHSAHAPHDLIYRTYLWNKFDFFKRPHIVDIWEPFYFGIITVMILFNFAIYIMTREKNYLYYTLFVSGSFLTFLSISGYGFQYIWPQIPILNERIGFIGLAFMMSFAGWFSISFLELKKNYPKLTKILHLCAFTLLAELLIFIFIPFDPEFRMVRILVGTALPIYFLCWVAGIITLKKVHDLPTKAYVIIWSILLLACILTFIHEMFIPLFPVPTFTFVQICHAIEVVLLSMAMANRINKLTIDDSLNKAKMDAQSKFMARMSHEIRTPLNGIVGMSDLLSKQVTGNTERHYVDIIHSSAVSLERIINDILDYSKIEAGKLQLRQHSFNIEHLVKSVTHLFELNCKQKNIRLQYQMDNSLPEYVNGDEERLRQILINLVGNAVKYTHSGSINIRITQKNHLTLFEIIDTGEGISIKDQDRLFKPFEQASNNNLSRESSTGLGLAISRELVSLMGGEMGFESELNKGSNFFFSLELPPAEAEFIIPEDTHNLIQLPVMNILVAEDNDVNKVVIKSILRNLGMNYTIVTNGIEVVGYFKEAHNYVDLILMDCEMPEMDGFKASEIIRHFENEKHLLRTPIIALTAHTWHKELEHCIDSGMNELLLKPITRHSVEILLNRYSNCIKNTRQFLAQN